MNYDESNYFCSDYNFRIINEAKTGIYLCFCGIDSVSK